jgi:DNA-binding NarL/FixJ family response regulator
MKRITVLLADDHKIVREGFRELLDREPDLAVIGEAQNGRQAVEMARKLRPDVVVMDIAMPLLNGLEATRQIRKAVPNSKVLILSAHCDDAYVEQAIESGALGFLFKQSQANTLPGAIREIQKGNILFSPSIVKHFRDQQSPGRSGLLKKKLPRLSSREMEVLQLIVEGQPDKQAAAELGISTKTVEEHRQNLMSKLHIHDLAGLTRYAIGVGIIESAVQFTIG